MLHVDNLSVGTVAGIIAAVVFTVQLAVPTLIPLILVGTLKKENSAATWSVVGRTLHASHWASILRSDTTGTQGVNKGTRLITAFQPLMLVLIAVTSIVTPLGLYDAVVQEKGLKSEPFSYAQDNSSMGIGTLERRREFGLSRMCWGFKPAVCPWSDTIINENVNETTYTADLPDGYDVRIPKNITEIYSAGHSKLANSVASVFDIEWRNYRKVLKSAMQKDGQSYLVGDYRQLKQMVLNDAYEPVEGLIVNTKTGGIGFRNHTTPPPFPFGSSWSEDILFIEPETECVDLNITLDFNIPLEKSSRGEVENVTVTDHGGFANFNRDLPVYDQNRTWANADLKSRAYVAAWYSNVYSMVYLNVTNLKNKEHARRFEYMTSNVGKTFPVKIETSSFSSGFQPSYDQLRVLDQYGGFLQIPDSFLNGSLVNTSYPNPFGISNDNFTDLAPACSNSNEKFYANISNIAVTCGMVYGAARRRDGSASLLFDPGTSWTVPMYSCASASKASIKSVSFRYNGTAGLKSLDILDIKSKSYASDDEKPLWGVENLKLRLRDTNPVWGITLPEYDKNPNISTARQEFLYLPGLASGFIGGKVLSPGPTNAIQYFAGIDFYSNAMATTYNQDRVDSNSFYGLPDYTGRSNLAMYNQWQQLSRNSSTVARVINLIWTDISANSVVGTKSQLPSEPLQMVQKREEVPMTVVVPITVYVRQVRFHLRYGIPAFITLALAIPLALAGLLFMVFGRAAPTNMRRYLDYTSAGRLLAMFLYTNDCPPGATRANWVRLVGGKRIDLGGLYPRATDTTTGVALGSADSVIGGVGTAATQAYGKMDDGTITLHSLPSPSPYSPVGAGGEAQSYYQGIDQSQYTYIPTGLGTPGRQNAYAEFRSRNDVSPLDAKPQ